jgi:hydrogenase maturation protease
MTRVEVLACGAADRGDDGAALIAASLLIDELPADVQLRVVGQLDIDDLLELPPEASVVIVDAATGIRPGKVLSVSLDQVAGDQAGLRPRSSHALAFPEVLGLAGLLRGRPVEGRLVVVGGTDFTLGGPLSRPVAAAIPALVAMVRTSVDEAWIGRPSHVEV